MKNIKFNVLIIFLLIFNISLSACVSKNGQLIISHDDLSALQAVLWAISPEREVQMLTQHRNNIKLFDEVIAQEKALPHSKINTDVIKWNQKTLTVKQNAQGETVPIVVVDLDETFIDNTPSAAYLLLAHQEFTDDLWTRWVRTKQAKIFAGVLEFVEHVHKKGALIIFVSNRSQDDHLEATKQNMINQNYPPALLENYVWWMKGKKDVQGKVITQKEDRYHYLENNLLKVADVEVKPQIMMVVGDDINDFNSNFTYNKDLEHRINYLKDQDINALFGNVAPKVNFLCQNNKVIKNYFGGVQKADKFLLNQGYINDVKNLVLSYNTYSFIGGNAMYGGWQETFKIKYRHRFNNINYMKEAVTKFLDLFQKWF